MFNFFNNQNNSNSRESSIENKNQSPYENESITNKESVHSNSTMDFDTLQKARRDLVGEILAVVEYDDHIHTSTDKLARETWGNIKNEELTHMGELLGLINYLDPTQKQYVEKGLKEFSERMGGKS